MYKLTYLSLVSLKREIGSVDSEQTLRNAAFDQGLHCLH